MGHVSVCTVILQSIMRIYLQCPGNNSFHKERTTGINFAKIRSNRNKNEEFITKFGQKFDLMKDVILNNINTCCQDSIKHMYQITSIKMYATLV